MKLKRNSYLSVTICFLVLQGCKTSQTNEKYKLLHIHQVLYKNTQELSRIFTDRVKQYKKRIKANNYPKRLLDKLQQDEKLGKESSAIINFYLMKLIRYIEKEPQKLSNPILDNASSQRRIKEIARELKEYAVFLRENFAPHLKDTTSWTRRYLKLLPPDERQNPPSFIDFYFKNTNRAEALVVLSTLRLGILQEALEIQEKILKEK